MALVEWQHEYESMRLNETDREQTITAVCNYIIGFDRINDIDDIDTVENVYIQGIADYVSATLYITRWFDYSTMEKYVSQRDVSAIISIGYDKSPYNGIKNEGKSCQTYAYPVETDITGMAALLPEIAKRMDVHFKRCDNVIIHCHDGRSLSVICVLWYLAKYHHVPLLKAVTHIKARRRAIRPNTRLLELCF